MSEQAVRFYTLRLVGVCEEPNPRAWCDWYLKEGTRPLRDSSIGRVDIVTRFVGVQVVDDGEPGANLFHTTVSVGGKSMLLERHSTRRDALKCHQKLLDLFLVEIPRRLREPEEPVGTPTLSA